MRNNTGNEWLNNCLISYMDRDTFVGTENEKNIQYFQNMENRIRQL